MILGPICQVGWRSACSGVAPAISAAEARAERTSGGSEPEAADRVPPVCKALVNRGVLAIHRNQPGPGCGCGARHHRSGGHQRFLVGEADDLAGAKGGERRAEARRADDPRNHESGARRGGGPLEPAGASRDRDPRQAPPVGVFELLGLLFAAEGHEFGPVALTQRVEPIGSAAGRKRDDPEPVRGSGPPPLGWSNRSSRSPRGWKHRGFPDSSFRDHPGRPASSPAPRL